MTIQIRASELYIAVLLFTILYKKFLKCDHFVSYFRIIKNLVCQPRFKKMRKYLWLCEVFDGNLVSVVSFESIYVSW